MIDQRLQDITPPLQPGYVTRTLLRWFMRPARIAAVEALSNHFRLIDLEGEALRGVGWAIGQKLQISMGAGADLANLHADGVGRRTRQNTVARLRAW